MTKGLNPYHVHLCLERTSKCRLDPQVGHKQEATYQFLSLKPTPIFLSPQISRIYPVCIVFFQVSNHPNGVGERREESSSKTVTQESGRLPPVSLSPWDVPLHPHQGLCSQHHLCCLFLPLACGAPWPICSLLSQTLVGSSGQSWGGDSLIPGKYCSPWAQAPL